MCPKTHATHLHADQMQIAVSLAIKRPANAFESITAIHSYRAVLSVSATTNAPKHLLASTTNVKILASEHADLKRFVRSSITFHRVHALKEQRETLSDTVHLKLKSSRLLNATLAILRHARLDLSAGDREAPLSASAFPDTSEILTPEAAIRNVQSTPTALSLRRVPITNVSTHARETFAATMQYVRR